MELHSIECVPSSDLTDEDEIHHHRPHQFPSISKPHNNCNNNNTSLASVINPGTTSVHELLECPVCTNSMYPPIHQIIVAGLQLGDASLDCVCFVAGIFAVMKCHNGHTLCSTCKTRVHNRCPTCRQELGDIRCLALEKVAESLELPCKYMSLGCPEIFPYYSKLKHEAICNFRPYNCPYAGSECSIVGDIPFLVAHLRDDHKVDMHSGCTFNHRYVKSNPHEVENATWMLTVFHCFGQYFCLHFEAFQLGMAPVYMAFLRFMGDETEARNYTYSLEVGGNGRKLTWEGTPRSIRDSHKKVRDSHDGLIIQRNMALFFSGGDRKELKLRVTGRIWKEQQSPEGGACIPNLCIFGSQDAGGALKSSAALVLTFEYNPFSFARSTQISAHFGRPTHRRNSLREKLVNDQQVHPKNPISLNPSSSENLNYDSVRESDLNYGFVNDSVVETSSSVEESKLKPLGKSVLSSKLENWTDQYKKDVDYWGIGSGPIFTVFQDSEGTVKKVLVDENEILKRTLVKRHEFEDLSKINSRILYAKSLAREMESGENVIPRNSSVAKFVVSGEESGFVDIVRGVIPGPEFVPKLSTLGRVVLCGLVVFWVGRKLFSFKKKRGHYTELEKEMMRRKINSRKEKEMLEKGSVQVVQGNTEPEGVTFEKPKINEEELMKNIMEANGSEDRLALENSSCSQTRGSKGFDDKILEIREMARRARAVEAEELSQADVVEEEWVAVDDELSDEIEEVKQKNEEYASLLSNLSTGGLEQGSDTDVTVVTTFLDEAKSLNTESSNKVPSSKKEIVQASGASSLEVSREWPKTNLDNGSTLGLAVQSSGTLRSESCKAETNYEKRKPKVIRSVKEAREFLSNIRNKPEFHQPLVKTFSESGNVLTQPSDIDCDRNTSQILDVDNVGSTTSGGASDSKPAPDASEDSTWKNMEHVPMKKHDPEYADEVNGGVDDQKSPISFDHEFISGSTKTGPSLKMENWVEKNFHEIEPMVKKIGVGFRDNFMAAREKVNQHLDTCDDIAQLISGEDDREFEWMKDDRLREIVFQVRDNELSGRDPFHLMDAEDKLAFFKGLEKKVEKENEKLLQLHEYLHSNIENLDYGAGSVICMFALSFLIQFPKRQSRLLQKVLIQMPAKSKQCSNLAIGTGFVNISATLLLV
ncbi:E3 ubiquitin-protein ligase SINAT3 [Citrus sinensis]|nr:E3 ubiquitin-protein ligase SINAT3 [Citrus sinensis]